MYLRARWYDPAHGTFTTPDPFPGWAGVPASQHPYPYAANSPYQYTDPSGRCFGFLGGTDTLLCAVLVGAAVGATIDYGTQVYRNYQAGRRGWDMFTHICADELLIAAVSGGVSGGVGFALGPLTAVLSKTGFWGSVIAGAFEGELAGGAAHVATNWLTGRAWNSGLGSALLSNAIGGGIGGGLGWVTKRVVQIIGFQGVGFDSPSNPYATRYSPEAAAMLRSEHGLIHAGHVGVSFNRGRRIYGFFPSDEAMAEIDREAVAGNVWLFDGRLGDYRLAKGTGDFLRWGGAMRGQVRNDTLVFKRAFELIGPTNGQTTLKYASYSMSRGQALQMERQVLRDIRGGGTR